MVFVKLFGAIFTYNKNFLEYAQSAPKSMIRDIEGLFNKYLAKLQNYYLWALNLT